MALTEQLKEIVGPKGYLEGDDIGERHTSDVSGRKYGDPILVLRPATTDEVSQVLALCNEAGQPVLTQGGMTGLTQGGIPLDGEVVLSLERMNAVEAIDARSGTATVQAGVVLQALEEQLETKGLMFPLDLGARGSCTIGGNLSTNAGGNRVLRYGMARDLVLGVEAVLADGTVVGGMNRLVKNNTGYDLKQLFIGSEGTLGVITRAVLKLFPQPRSQSLALCTLNSFPQVTDFLTLMRRRLPGTLSAFEVMWQSFFEKAISLPQTPDNPFDEAHAFYVLVETQGGDQERDAKALEEALADALESGVIQDAVIAKSGDEAKNLWLIRDASMEVYLTLTPGKSYDVSFPLDAIQPFSEKLTETLAERWPESELVMFGHLGDGNVHPLTNADNGGPEIDEVLFGLTSEFGGSISAEHGIGLSRRGYLGLCKSDADIELMQTMKRALDPKNILNPGRIIEMDA